jgi:hypothetical protein
MAADKFKAMVHYIVDSCEEPMRLGATRLNKICWYSDTYAYRLKGRSITGETYVKRKRGPVPKTILRIIRELEREGKIHVREHEFLPSKKIRLFVSLEDADRSVFEADEAEIIDLVRKHICEEHTAASISEASHDCIWEAANDGEEIPMAATLVAQRAELTDTVSTWAKDVIRKAAGVPKAA